MGQRHMTYVVADVDGGLAVQCLYNQWNFEVIQPHKVVRFLNALKKWEHDKAKYVGASDVCTLYQFTASVHDSGISYFQSEDENYDEKYGMYDEDNNNGWQIVYIKRGKGEKKFEVSVGFKPGNEWGSDYKTKGYLPLQEYIESVLENINEPKTYTAFLADFSKQDQKVLKRINDEFNLGTIGLAEQMVKVAIEKIQASKTKKRGAA